ncbi:MAG TPA: serine/threonine-protein kinase [Polyangiaceae bacterium]|nr:serine/threonine-protein kinase [Polyangiaceae bacterium]
MSTWSPEDILAGKYRLVRKLGAGAAAEAWEAENVLLERRVAVKILHPHLATDAKTRSRFLAEARASARFSHPNVVTVFDIGVAEQGAPFIVMELCDGETLSTVIDHRGAMGVSYAADVMAQVLAALHAAHEIGIVHRDLKPDNIMLVHPRPDEPLVKVLDFGIAQGILGDSPEEGGFVFGTPEYMPPEQARGETVDARADLYAAGAMLYELLTCEVPFHGDDATETLARVLTSTPTPPSTKNWAIPPALDALVLSALSKDPDGRPATAGDFLAALVPFTSSGRGPSLSPSAESEAPVPLVAGRGGPPASSAQPVTAPPRKLELVADTVPPPPHPLLHRKA